MAPQMCEIQRSYRQETVSRALLPTDITDPFAFWKLDKDNKRWFCFTVGAMFKNKEKHQLKIIGVFFSPKRQNHILNSPWSGWVFQYIKFTI